MRQSINYHLSS
ncbi:hypothetical protein RSOL_383350 [Rhizoctonia solani AG-3 Rhs1AP]|uniref:Uncharacterized protein n=1 Tax=Rhizoctonia solani AG-3 Rhs1AP TaxID=1086054 RepID=X8JAQ9_9AGAM|nr:hypothetical protein RSOL_383350 [Rhizoctonia solani AG-3 Rhs1AP]